MNVTESIALVQVGSAAVAVCIGRGLGEPQLVPADRGARDHAVHGSDVHGHDGSDDVRAVLGLPDRQHPAVLAAASRGGAVLRGPDRLVVAEPGWVVQPRVQNVGSMYTWADHPSTDPTCCRRTEPHYWDAHTSAIATGVNGSADIASTTSNRDA